MTVLWLIGGSLQSMQYLQDLEDERPPRFEFVNHSDLHRHRMRIEGEYAHHSEAEREPLAFSGMPAPVFRVGDPAFALDYFDAGVACASPRLRRALALCGDSVRYRDVDMDESPPAVVARGYQAMNVTSFADPFDREQTSGGMADVTGPDGALRREWQIATPDPSGPPLKIRWRDDFVAPAPLFRVPGTAWTLATEGLAAAVMQAGIVDLVFQDVVSQRARHEAVFRQ